jgi:hypothetical protein
MAFITISMPSVAPLPMAEHITEREMELIAEFAETPMYKRSPEQLIPEDEEG